MRRFGLAAIILTLVWSSALSQEQQLRAVYLASNPTQAVRDAATGELRGVSVNLAKEIAKRLGQTLRLEGEPTPPAIIDAVRDGNARIGFVAFESSRTGTVAFSQTYMLTRQTFLVSEASGMSSIADLDKPGRKIGGLNNDSITLCLQRVFKNASIVTFPNDLNAIRAAVQNGTIDAFGSNFQRLTALVTPGVPARVLDETYFFVPQNVVVPQNDAALLELVNKTIAEMRTSGELEKWVSASGVVGLQAAPEQPAARYGCPE